MVIGVPKIYPACPADDKIIKSGSKLTATYKRAAEPSKAESLYV